MWYEILPSALIILAATAFPNYGVYFMNWLVLNHGHRRCMNNFDQRNWYMRDGYKFGSPYKFVGLDEFFDDLDSKNRGENGSREKCVCEDDVDDK